MVKRLVLILGTEMLLFGLLIAIPLLVSNTFVLGLLTLLAMPGLYYLAEGHRRSRG